MLETPEEMANLQALLDDSMAGAGPHLRDVITDERRLRAAELTERLQGMRLLVLATLAGLCMEIWLTRRMVKNSGIADLRGGDDAAGDETAMAPRTHA